MGLFSQGEFNVSNIFAVFSNRAIALSQTYNYKYLPNEIAIEKKLKRYSFLIYDLHSTLAKLLQ